MSNIRYTKTQFVSDATGARTLPKDYIDYSQDNKGNALAIKDAIPFGDITDIATNPGTSGNIIQRLAYLQAQQYVSTTTDYICITATTGFNVGDYAKQIVNYRPSDFSTVISTYWLNYTTGLLTNTAPTLSNFILKENALDSQNVTRLVNSTASSVLVKATNTFIKSIYFDNISASVVYLDLYQGLTASPANSSTPLESYRCPSNGSISLELNRVYTGQTYLAFSSTAGPLTLSSSAKNLIIKYV